MTAHIREGSVYASLPDYVEEMRQDLGLASSSKSRFLTSFLQNHVPARLIQEGFEDMLRYQQKSFSFSNNIINRKGARKQSKSVKRLNAKQRKQLKLKQMKPEEQRFELYLPLHSLWKDYISDLVDLKRLTSKNLPEYELKLMKADLHGSLLSVTKAKCPSLIGTSGIVLQETKNTFKLITSDDKFKTIPKQNAAFSLAVGEFIVTIYGNNFMFKSSDRSTRSFKTKPTIDF